MAKRTKHKPNGEDTGPLVPATAKSRKPPVRRVWGRLRNVEVGDKLYTFELTRAGLRVRKRHSRTVHELPFEQLVTACVGVVVPSLGEDDFRFKLDGMGLWVQQGHLPPVSLCFMRLANLGREQPLLFLETATGSKNGL